MLSFCVSWKVRACRSSPWVNGGTGHLEVELCIPGLDSSPLARLQRLGSCLAHPVVVREVVFHPGLRIHNGDVLRA